ncbi:MAG: DNA repair exonuclease [Gemmatimonadota bacterium]|nr:DNA repair exonuclease [Gemmatimonadota bacterium]
MRLVHLSDLHLGFRQYQRLTPIGANQREADVALTFRRVVDRVIALGPDLILIAGDVFHTVRPPNPAILHAFQQFNRLADGLPGVPIVVVAGNHDLPRASETGCILRLFEQERLYVADFEARRLSFPALGVSVLAVPDVPGGRPELTPDPAARHNVLLIHGEVEGVIPQRAAVTDRATYEITKDELRAPQWSYVALGHYHVHREVAPNAYYSGSIDYTSANAWGELAEEREAGLPGKGFVEFDLDTGAHIFHPLPPSRVLADLPPFTGRGMTGAELDAAIRGAVDGCPGGIDDKIVRLVVRDVARHIVNDLDHQALREFKRRAFHFQLELLRPDTRSLRGEGGSGHPQSLADFVRERLRSRQLTPGVDRDQLVARVFEYLDQATAAELAAAGEAEG